MIGGSFLCLLPTMKPILLTPPDKLSAAQRAFEITNILAAAIVRTYKSDIDATEANERRFGLDYSGQQRVHTNHESKRSSV